MSHKTDNYRDIEIRYGYNIAIDGYTANFVLPEKQTMQLTIPHTGFGKRPPTMKPGKNRAYAETEDEALALAREMIDSYLDEG